LGNSKNLFTLSFILLIITYLFVFGRSKTLEIILSEYLLILSIIPIIITLFYFKKKLHNTKIIDFNKNNQFSLKSSIGFFLIFQVADYFYEDGFIGMISQWFLYWVLGIITLLLLQTINYFKNYQVLKNLNLDN